MSEEMAIISDVHIGTRDVGRPVLWFTVCVMDGGCALQVKSMDEATQIISDAQVYQLEDMNGRACVVETGGGMMKYKRMLKK